MKFCFRQEAGEGNIHKLYLYDTVEKYGRFNWSTWEFENSETSAKYFRDQLNAIPNDHVIHLHINSQGGEIGEGVTIYNLLRQKSQEGCKVIGFVDGMAYSVAADIAMGCDELHMGLGTSMLLHFPWMRVTGNAEQLLEAAAQLEALGEASVQLYMSRAKGLTADELREMMRKETVLDPESCLKYGFCDVVDEYREEEDPVELVAQLREEIVQMRERLAAMQEAKLSEPEPEPTPEPVVNKRKVADTLADAMRIAIG
jgi:ATP-dependent protease ClpP protease subunit